MTAWAAWRSLTVDTDEFHRTGFHSIPPEPLFEQQLYVPPANKPKIYLVDVDGTVALKADRDPFDWHRVGEDLPNVGVIKVVRKVADPDGQNIVFFSGRKEQCRKQTDWWLRANVIPDYRAIFMRADDDNRFDYVTKREMFERHIRNDFDCEGVFDDRRLVVEMWRSLGLTVFAVAEGNF